MEPTLGSQEHLDSIYYKRKVYGFERIFGRGWISVGGENMAKDYFSKLSLEPGSKILDAGCGTGGCAFFMARYYGLIVHGVDLSKNVIDIVMERLPREDDEVKDKVRFEVADLAQVEIEYDTYDAIYCRSVILFVTEKEGLFKKMHMPVTAQCYFAIADVCTTPDVVHITNCSFFLEGAIAFVLEPSTVLGLSSLATGWLKPGGTLFFTDYCLGNDGQYSKTLWDLIQMRGYNVRTLEDYGRMIQDAGFKDKEVTDATDDYVRTMHRDKKHFGSIENAFIKDFSKQEYDDLLKMRTDMIKIFSSRDLVYVVVFAKK